MRHEPARVTARSDIEPAAFAPVADPRPPLWTAPLAALLAIKLAAHVVTNLVTPYELHRDELLYLAMGSHLRLWHMEFPPMIALLAQTARVFGDGSLFAVRMIPALAGLGVLALAVLIARELGGGRMAQLLTGTAVLMPPIFLRPANLFQPVVLDQLWWLLGFYALARWLNTRDPRYWLLLGAAGGLGLLTKFSILFFGFAVLAALLATRERRAFATPWPWIAIGMALLIGHPSIVGQVALGFPVAGQMENLREVQLQRTSFGDFVMGQVRWGPGIGLAVAGATGLLLLPALKRYRVLGIAGIVAFAAFAVAKGKHYYVGPIYPMLYAAGGVLAEQVSRPRFRGAVGWGAGALIVLYGVATLPFGLPILEPATMARYAAATGMTAAVTTNRGVVLRLPQDYGDMLGWRAQADAVAQVYDSLPPEDQARTVLFAANYGEAGALDLYGPRHGLPPVVSFAGSFYYFGVPDRPADIVLTLGVSAEDLGDYCGVIEAAGRVTHTWTVEENDVPIFVCREPRRPLADAWREATPSH
jgi:hypothetical protein